MVYDVAIIGGGIVGTAILNKLTRLGASAVLIEKGLDVSVGTTKANSGIVHAGFDAKAGTLKAKLNVRGAELYPSLCKELNVPYINNGALVIGNDLDVVMKLYARGVENGVMGLEVLDRTRILELLPNVSDNVTCGLLAKTSAIVSPYKMAIALAEEAVINGARVELNFETVSFEEVVDYYKISNGEKDIFARKVVLSVGNNHNKVARIFGAKEYPITFRRGEYYLLDKYAYDTGGFTVFPLPSKAGKGVLVSPTTAGNIIVGPTSCVTDSDSTVTTKEGLEEIATKTQLTLKNIPFKKNIRVFSGVRCVVGDDFVIEKDTNNSDIINVTGICSPGLSSAPAIAEMVADLLGIKGKKKSPWKTLKPKKQISKMTTSELNKLIKKDSRYGKIVCRCECISEGEIVEAINSPLKPISLDGIKRRTRAGMGRCQGGFCFSKVMELIAKERNIPIEQVTKENANSNIIVGDINL